LAISPIEAERILIVRLSALGDVVHTLPMLDALRRARPRAHIGWLVEEPAASLLEGHPQLDRVWIAPRHAARRLRRDGRPLAAAGQLLEVARALRAARYQLTLDAQCNLRSSLWTLASGARARVGFAPPFTKEKAHWGSTIRVEAPRDGQLKAHRNLELLRPLGIDTAGAHPRIQIPEAARRITDPLRAAGARAIALHPGVSGFGAIKQWAPDRFAALARRMRDERGARCLVTFGPAERDLAREVVAGSGGAAELAPETRNLLELAALYQACDVVVAGDTGPLHLAAALGVPVVGLYGPKDPAVYGPLDGRTGAVATTVWKHVHCSPCKLRRCGNVICMPAITVADVVGAIEHTLGAPARTAARSALG
jgi:ADP-heptose:LPS heptosyltransferase